MLARLRPPTVSITSHSENMLRMVANGRCYYWFIDAEEARWFLQHYQELAERLEVRPRRGVPTGQTRHLMCSKQVPRHIDLGHYRATAGDAPRQALRPRS